jgi:cilia- and flagella-associated protein 52
VQASLHSRRFWAQVCVSFLSLTSCEPLFFVLRPRVRLQQAPIFLWDFETAASLRQGQDPSIAILHKLLFHKGGITSLDFSHDTAFLASLGSPEDNAICVWEVAAGRAVCGTPAGSHAALTVQWFRNRSDRLITGGQFHMRTWDLNMERRRLFPEDWKTGSVKRIFTCVALDPTDTRAFCGTTSGDMLEFNLTNGSFAQASKVRFSLGIVCAKYCPGLGGREDTIVVGTGDGAIARLSARDLDVKGVAELMGGVTSLAFPGEDLSAATGGEYQRLLAGTDQGNLYALNAVTLETSLLSTAHSLPITDVCFPAGTSDLFLTASGGEIRLWNSKKCAELLRIQVPNLQCHCIAINKAGTSIVSGWSDGKVRAFLPESGKLQYAIPDAHVDAVTAVAFTHDGSRVVSGGKDGRVRVWSVSGKSQPMEISFKEHKKEVTSIVVSHNDEEAVSASADGSCLIWNIKRGARLNALFSSTIFRSCVYHPDESQLLTAGSDRKITYWDATDCTAIRVMDGSTEEVSE